jgi:hypothetical protein
MSNKPEKTFRIGPVSASVFVNRTKEADRPFRTATLERRYQEGEDWKSSSSFALSELAAVVAVAQMALHYIAEKERRVAP